MRKEIPYKTPVVIKFEKGPKKHAKIILYKIKGIKAREYRFRNTVKRYAALDEEKVDSTSGRAGNLVTFASSVDPGLYRVYIIREDWSFPIQLIARVVDGQYVKSRLNGLVLRVGTPRRRTAFHAVGERVKIEMSNMIPLVDIGTVANMLAITFDPAAHYMKIQDEDMDAYEKLVESHRKHIADALAKMREMGYDISETHLGALAAAPTLAYLMAQNVEKPLIPGVEVEYIKKEQPENESRSETRRLYIVYRIDAPPHLHLQLLNILREAAAQGRVYTANNSLVVDDQLLYRLIELGATVKAKLYRQTERQGQPA